MNKEKWMKVISKIRKDNSVQQGLCNQFPKRNNINSILSRKFKLAIGVSVAMCMLISVSAIAKAAPATIERMKMMDKNEVEYLNEMTQGQKVETDTFSRKLTENEKTRKKSLIEAYTYQGKFPDDKIKFVDREESETRTELCYNTQNSTFYLPERTLTDEELLQIIEFNKKRDYSLQVINKKDISKKSVNDTDVISNNKILEKAQYVISSVYNVTSEDIKNDIEYSRDENQYEVIFSEGTGEYIIRIDSSDLAVKSMSADFEDDISSYKIVTEEMARDEKILYEKSENIIKNILGNNQKIKSAWCNYFVGDGGRGQDRKLHYLFELKDGGGYIFRYVQETEILYEFIYMSSFNNYESMMKQNDTKDLQRGIKREQFKIGSDF